MAEPLKPDWSQLHCLPFREIMQYVASESLEDLSNCRLACKTWNDQIIGYNIWKHKIVKSRKNWDEGEPKYSTKVLYIEEIRGIRGDMVHGDTYAAFNYDTIVLLQGENCNRKSSLKFEKDEWIESMQVTKDVIVVVTRINSIHSGTRRLSVHDIKTRSKLMFLELKSEQFLSEGSLILLYNKEINLLKDVKVIDVYDQNSSFTYTPKELKIYCFLSFKNSTVMSSFKEMDKPNKVSIFEISTKDRKMLRKYIIPTDSGIPLGGFFAEPNLYLLHQDDICVYNVDGHFVRRIKLPYTGYNLTRAQWYFDYGRVVVTKFDRYLHRLHVNVWKIEDLASKDGKPRSFEYDFHEILDGLRPVINRECIRIHLSTPSRPPRERKSKWLKMKF